ncbi:hypothetical protein LN461_13055 [Xanthomonas arboricola]|uniref:hypothetical protein n=1 Tax=Xanthomonas arboricola TaxID=56448 RepID=UPI001E4DB222|nr:hypothetical protein [Xanthomonas arboricola]MCC8670271.1 hypothetical protein [Xanthomonas arboricola]
MNRVIVAGAETLLRKHVIAVRGRHMRITATNAPARITTQARAWMRVQAPMPAL